MVRPAPRGAEDLVGELRTGRVDAIGDVLAEHWRLKMRLSSAVTNTRVHELHDAAINAGATGGKLLGAGGGGFLLFAVPTGKLQAVEQAMADRGARQLTFELAPNGSSALLLDTMVTTVPLPDIPLRLDGTALREIYPLAPLAAGHALAIAVYRSCVHVGLLTDPTCCRTSSGSATPSRTRRRNCTTPRRPAVPGNENGVARTPHASLPRRNQLE